MAPKQKKTTTPAAGKKEEEKEEAPKAAKAAEAAPAKAAAKAAAEAAPAKAAKAAEAAPAEAKKRKAEETPKAEPAKKEAKAEPAKKKEAKDVKEEAAEDANAEKEHDAPADKRSPMKESVTFYPEETTLNVIAATGGKVLAALSEGGVQYLVAAARANVGIKAGRYAFEVKVLENKARQQPRQIVRLGFSVAGSPLILGDGEDHVCFDSEGVFLSGKTKKTGFDKFGKDQVLAVVLNLDSKSPNANTISLFRDGVRVCPPQPLPESMHGKPLFPHVAYRYATLQVSFGPEPAKPLPFKCRYVQSASQADVEVAAKPADGKFEVLFPVGVPDEGTFDWLDGFLAKNPQYVELSDRKVVQWAESSGLWRGKSTSWKNSNDKPDFNFGLPGMDDSSARRVLHTVAPIVPRNYVVMEVKSNLIEAERKELLKRFSGPQFNKVAHVVMGEPTKEFKAVVQAKALKDKQEKSDAAWKAKKAETERKKQLAEMKKKQEEAAKKVAADKKAAEEAKKKAAAAAAVAAAKEEGDEDKMEVDDVKEEVKEEAKEEEEKKDEPMEEAEEDGPPKVELTEEEKKVWFPPAKANSPDLSAAVLKQAFPLFTVPEAAEGFNAVRYEWQKEAAAKEYLRNWVLEKKRNSRIEDLVPGQWFQEKLKEWQKTMSEWQAKQKAHQAAAKKEAASKAKEEKAEEKADGEGEGDAEDEKDNVDDIFSVTDVTDVGNGEPLFKDFAFEDWALLQLRYELYLLHRAFTKDVNDPDRVCHESHFSFYYNKYYRKMLTPQHFGVTNHLEVVALVKEAVHFDEAKVLVPTVTDDVDDLDTFVKQTEEARRARQRRFDAGDETARLKFSTMAMQKANTSLAAGTAGVAGSAGGKWPGKGPAVAGKGGLPAWPSVRKW